MVHFHYSIVAVMPWTGLSKGLIYVSRKLNIETFQTLIKIQCKYLANVNELVLLTATQFKCRLCDNGFLERDTFVQCEGYGYRHDYQIVEL